MAAKILILNGPNLNMLGQREANIYGSETLDDIAKLCAKEAEGHGLEVDMKQSNNEGDLIDMIQAAGESYAGVIINPAGYTHTSVAIMDALLTLKIPVVEVHMSNIHKREEFRHHSYVSKVAEGVICGFGAQGYAMAVRAISSII
jgi:3-dehydroquinate dehydratase-2